MDIVLVSMRHFITAFLIVYQLQPRFGQKERFTLMKVGWVFLTIYSGNETITPPRFNLNLVMLFTFPLVFLFCRSCIQQRADRDIEAFEINSVFN